MTEENTDWDKLHLEAAESTLEKTRQTLEYVLQGEGYADLIAACDEALNWADANARWFDISTAPKDEAVLLWSEKWGFFQTGRYVKETSKWVHEIDCGELDWPTHWRPLPPPPTNPPLPAVFTQLGQALERLKEAR